MDRYEASVQDRYAEFNPEAQRPTLAPSPAEEEVDVQMPDAPTVEPRPLPPNQDQAISSGLAWPG
eukprot:4815978-Prorocentrum_lima.AAC.1